MSGSDARALSRSLLDLCRMRKLTIATAESCTGGLVAGALIADSVREGSASEDDMERCASTFRSFDPDTGTYVTYGGEVRVCPYLR